MVANLLFNVENIIILPSSIIHSKGLLRIGYKSGLVFHVFRTFTSELITIEAIYEQ